MESVEVRLALLELDALSGLVAGESFDIAFSAQGSGSSSGQAIFSFYTDVAFDPSFLSAESIRYNDDGRSGNFSLAQQGSINNALGVISEVGATANIFNSASSSTSTVFTVRFKVLKTGQFTISTNASEETLSQITVVGIDGDQRNNTSYGSLDISTTGNDSGVPRADATIYIDAATNRVIGNAFQQGQIYSGALYSNTDAEFGTGISSRDIIVGTNGADNIWGGLEGNDMIEARDGNDIIGMSLGDAIVDAGSGNDFVYGLGVGGGNNIVNLNAGADNFWASAGNNTVRGSGDNVIGIGTGNDSVNTGAGNDFIYSVAGGGGTNVLNLGAGDNTIYLEQGDYTITTGAGADNINLGSGTDTVNAGNGNNIIYIINPNSSRNGSKDILAGSGSDYIQTGSGRDRIDAGIGLNTLFGGSGADTFVFRSGAYNFIGDFTTSFDRIELSGLSFDQLIFSQGSGTSAADAFIFAGSEAIGQVANITAETLSNSASFV